MSDSIVIEESPFATRLYRTAYFVMPRLALEAMPMEWQKRFEAMIVEMEEAGIKETPEYFCFVQDNGTQKGALRNMAIERGEYDPEKAYYVFVDRKFDDPWANYRRGRIEDLCPEFKR